MQVCFRIVSGHELGSSAIAQLEKTLLCMHFWDAHYNPQPARKHRGIAKALIDAFTGSQNYGNPRVIVASSPCRYKEQGQPRHNKNKWPHDR